VTFRRRVPLLGAIPEDSEIIISTNRGEPLVKKEIIIIIAFENAARRLVGKQDYFVDLNAPYKGLFAQFVHSKNFKTIFLIDLLF
jgi:septum site-determining protein MinD